MDRPGWSEGPGGKQLTADLKAKRSVAMTRVRGAHACTCMHACSHPYLSTPQHSLQQLHHLYNIVQPLRDSAPTPGIIQHWV